jgi:gamma-glutamylcyclotransferase
MPLYFAFGSNLDAEQMAERCPGSRAAFRARLADHRIDFTYPSRRWGGGAADIVPAPGESVWGMVWELTEGQLEILDRFEQGYERVELLVLDAAGRPHRVASYRVRDKGTHRPTRHYLDKMLRWGARWEFPDDYLALLRAVATQDRPGPALSSTGRRPRPR